MDNKHTLNIITLTIAILIVSTSTVLAFGIGSPYWKNHPLEISPGESKEILFNLQNCPALSESCDQSDVNIIATFEEGSDIAEITSGLSYLVPYGTADTNIKLLVTIPESASIGDSYNIKFSVTTPPTDEEGTIQFGVRYGVVFPVKIIEKPTPVTEITETPETPPQKSQTSTIIIMIIAILIIIIIIWWLVKRKT